jgi:hypothetical protein
MAGKPVYLRMPERTRALIEAIREATGMTLTQVIIQAVELLATKLGIKV